MKVRYRNRLATTRTIKALRATGRLEACDEALIGLAQTSAVALDEAVAFEDKTYAIAKMGTWHLQCVLALMDRLPEVKGRDDVDEMLRILNAMPLGDASEEPWGSP